MTNLHEKMQSQGLPHSAGTGVRPVFIRNHDSEFADDGGPGSGNWGHRGRPGKVGGSGPGGGRQYRGGRADIGYFNSRNDWLNGLSGEKQSKASRILSEARKNTPYPEEASPEEYIMQEGTRDQKKELTDLVGEARSWGKRGHFLANKEYGGRLTKEETGCLFMLTVQMDDLSQDEFVNFDLDRVYDRLTPEEQDLYLQLKAKACGITNEEIDLKALSEGLQRKLGVIPILSITPDRTEEDDIFKNKMRKEDLEKLESILSKAGLSYNFDQPGWRVFSTENNLQMKMMDERGIEITKEYLDAKDVIFDSVWEDGLKSGGDQITKNIGRGPTESVKLALEWYSKQHPEYSMDDPKKVEDALLSDKSVSEELRDNYLTIKMGALGASGNSSADTSARYIRSTIRRYTEAEERQKKEEAAKKYFTDRSVRHERYEKESNATTTEELMNIMRDSKFFKDGAKISLGAVPVENAKNLVVDGIERMIYVFPFMAGRFDGIDLEERGGNVYGSCFYSAGGKVSLNTKYYCNSEEFSKSYDHCVETNFHPAGTTSGSVVVHEFGHALDGFLTGRGILDSSFVTDARGFSGRLRANVLKSLKLHKKDIEAELCRYATKDASEWFAECMAEALTSPKPRRMAAECLKQLRQVLKDNGFETQEFEH